MKLIEVTSGVCDEDVIFVIKPASRKEEADFFDRVSAITSDTYEIWVGEDICGVSVDFSLLSIDREFEAKVRELLERYQ